MYLKDVNMTLTICENRKFVGLKTLLRNILEVLFAFCLVLNGNSVWLNIKSTRNWFGRGLQILILLLMSILLLIHKFKKNYLKNACFIFGGGSVYLIILGIVHPNSTNGLVGFTIISVAIISFAYLYKSIGRMTDILYTYENIIVIIAIISIVFWIFGSVLKIIPISGYAMFNWTDSGLDKQINNYWGLYYETQWTFLQGYGMLTRNTAIFTEAPMCSLHFSFALLIEAFLKEKLNFKKYVFFILAILTTFSTTGYLIVAITVFSRMIYIKNKVRMVQYLKILGIPLSLISGLIASIILIQLKLDSGSGILRLDDFVAGYKAWMENPLFGSGFGNYDVLIRHMSFWRQSKTGFSNSIMQVLAYGGIYFGIVYMIPFVVGIYNAIHWKQYRHCVFIGGILFMFVFTIIPFKFLTIFLLGYIGLSDKGIGKS